MKWGEGVLVVYDSLTGQCERFAKKLNEECVDILEYTPNDSPIFLITRSWDFGKVTDETQDFLNKYSDKVIALAVGGNRNWGTNFGAAGDKISKQYGIELVLKFEGSGFGRDVDFVKEWISTNREGNYER